MIRVSVLVLIAAGCSRSHRQEPPWPAPTPVARTEASETSAYQKTSLWNDSAALTRVYDDHRARRIGDLVTVVVVETSEAQREASTGVSRDTSVSANVSQLLGAEAWWESGVGFEPKVGAGTSNSFKGSGTTKHKDVLRTRVAARVVHILEDGNLIVEGRRQVKVHEDTQYLYVRGIARSADISTDNTIMSTALADAQILYEGSGLLANQQSPGWLYQVLDVVWPF